MSKAPTTPRSGKTEAEDRKYEDFNPHLERQERVLVRLPDFKRNELRVSRKKGRVTVEGEHRIGENKWKRFQENLPIPNDCVEESITARFENGILAITMPLRTKKQDQGDKETAPNTHVPPHKEETQGGSPPKTTSGEDRENPTPQKPLIQSEVPPNLTPAIHPAHVTDNNKHDNKADKAESQIASYRQAIKRLTESNEDKQLLVNAVVAVLVIVALGAYIFRTQVTE
ncbi:unnamed protein product [Cuscuta campestris]|uniref:SHSP domain-containing protein n=1 Tax=Cuscuta campestris TaxID=132261 RepID=A0A484KKM3_9ASTE|nr:unnamed protein product [Cuscuta campestris]